jgi:hypothetical protein
MHPYGYGEQPPSMPPYGYGQLPQQPEKGNGFAIAALVGAQTCTCRGADLTATMSL